MLSFMEEVLYGLRGIVTSSSGEALEAMISIDGHDNNHSETYTDPYLGNYHRPIFEGTYDFTYSAWGYQSQTHTIAIPYHDVVVQDVVLEPAALAQIDGIITDAQSGIPLFGVWLEVMNTPLPNEMTDNLGEFNFCDVPAGEYELFIFANGYSSLTQMIEITAGTNTLELELMPSNAISFETGSFPEEYDFSFSGNADWFITDETAYDGMYSAQSGSIGNNRTSSLILDIELPENGSVSFRKRISSEENYDFLYFYIDGSLQDEWSGSSAWTRETYSLQAGQHSLEWRYDKDGSVAGGADCGWIDAIDISGYVEPDIILGDIDDNSLIEAYDASLIQRYVTNNNPGNAAPIPWKEWRFLRADVDGNGILEAYDASLIIQYYLEIIDTFPGM